MLLIGNVLTGLTESCRVGFWMGSPGKGVLRMCERVGWGFVGVCDERGRTMAHSASLPCG